MNIFSKIEKTYKINAAMTMSFTVHVEIAFDN